MDTPNRPFAVKIYRWLVLTPLSYIMEILLTAQMAWMGAMVTFFENGRDYQSALVTYIDRSLPAHYVGAVFLILSLFNFIALARRWHIPRFICLICNIAYLLVYVGAVFITRPFPLGISITVAMTTVTILALFKLSNIRVYDSKVH